MELIVALILTCLGTCFGQLLARIYYLNNSSDKWWLMIPPLSVPPLSIIPTTMLASGIIHEGEGKSQLDWYILIPLLNLIVSPFLIGYLSSSEFINFIFSTTLGFMTTYVAFYLRDINNCTSYQWTMAKTIVTIICVALTDYVFSYIPFSSSIMEMISGINSKIYLSAKIAFNIIVFITAYISCNMFMTTTCKS
jgi:hypothetical protein